MKTTTRCAEKQNVDSTLSHVKDENSMIMEYKRRMLAWPNPVEFVNNMYGTHPDHRNADYFEKIYGK